MCLNSENDLCKQCFCYTNQLMLFLMIFLVTCRVSAFLIGFLLTQSVLSSWFVSVTSACCVVRYTITCVLLAG